MKKNLGCMIDFTTNRDLFALGVSVTPEQRKMLATFPDTFDIRDWFALNGFLTVMNYERLERRLRVADRVMTVVYAIAVGLWIHAGIQAIVKALK